MPDATDQVVTHPSETISSETPDSHGLPRRLRGTHEVQDAVPASAVARTNPSRLEAALEHAKICARIAADNRAKDVLLLDLRGVTPLVDFFVIASASSRRQASSMAFEIDADMKKLGEKKLGIEGAEEGRWTLIDYGDFVVHIFSPDDRAYYALEEIWGDAPQLEWQGPRTVHPATVIEPQPPEVAEKPDESGS
jgi:ribosome-associated protein